MVCKGCVEPEDGEQVEIKSFVLDPPHLLGQCIESSAAPVAALNDFEEMMISLVHPFIQVYTIPSTGELAFTSHVCNFRQRVHHWITELPIRPSQMPFVLVRPRVTRAAPDARKRPPFPVRMDKIRTAYEWLKKNNPHYENIEWDEENVAAWDEEDLPTRDEDLLQHVMIDEMLLNAWLGGVQSNTGGKQHRLCRRRG